MKKLVISFWLLVIGQRTKNSKLITQNQRGFSPILVLTGVSVLLFLVLLSTTFFTQLLKKPASLLPTSNQTAQIDTYLEDESEYEEEDEEDYDEVDDLEGVEID